MNCRDFIAEFEQRNALTKAAQLHLNDCPGCRKTIVVQTHIWTAIDGLTKVDAPKNFGFTVRARIANRQPSSVQPKLMPILRYVLPLSAIVLVLGLLAFNTSFFFGNSDAPQIAEQITLQTPAAAEIPSNNFLPPEQIVVNSNSSQTSPKEEFIAGVSNQSTKPSNNKQATPQFVVLESTRKIRKQPRRENVRDDSVGGGSQDLTSTETRVLTPEGFPSRSNEIKPNIGSLPVARSENIGSLIGVEIVSENKVQKVKAVKPNSRAARSGVKVGDVIEAIDGVKLSAKPISGEKIRVKTLTVLRGTEKVEISLKN